MFIIIYNDGNHVIKSELESAFSLPGNYFVFSVGSTFQFNQKDGICYYNNNKEIEKFRINNLELIDVEERKYSNTPLFRFSIYDHFSDTIIKIDPKSNILRYALSSIITKMISASKYPNWETYDKVIKIEEFKLEIKSLKEQVEILKKQNEELTARINIIQNPSS